MSFCLKNKLVDSALRLSTYRTQEFVVKGNYVILSFCLIKNKALS